MQPLEKAGKVFQKNPLFMAKNLMLKGIICTIKMEIYAHEYMRAPAGPCEKLWPAAADRRWISTFF